MKLESEQHRDTKEPSQHKYKMAADYLLEGFSNETLLLLFIVIFMSLLATYLWANLSDPDQTIHPDQRAAVLETREQRAASGRNGPISSQRREIPNDGRFEQCPICLDQMAMATETNCGHVFCGPCIIAYWENGASALNGMNCPICRQSVSLLLPFFTEEDTNSDNSRECLAKIHVYNRRFSGERRTLIEYIQDFPVLFRHLLRELVSVDGLVWMFRARIILYLSLAVVYLISPLDLIPEALTGVLGFFDDIIVLMVVLVYVTVLYRHHITEQ